MDLETSNERLSRVTTGLLKVISFCDLEIRECKTQILVREESLKIHVIDNRPTLEQLDKYRETLNSLMEKIETVSQRVALSKAEIKRLTKVIKDLSTASVNVEEVRSLVEHYQANVRHHSDIIRVGGLELDVEEKRAGDIRSMMARMQDELVRTEGTLAFVF
jgi:septation ring formation regulator EzrA